MSFNWWVQGQQDAYNNQGRDVPMGQPQHDQYQNGFDAGKEQAARDQEQQQQQGGE